jgi:deoxyribodipyrimidine photolyase
MDPQAAHTSQYNHWKAFNTFYNKIEQVFPKKKKYNPATDMMHKTKHKQHKSKELAIGV